MIDLLLRTQARRIQASNCALNGAPQSAEAAKIARPVLWSIGFAWVTAGLLMHSWLQGFAYHVDLNPWIFLTAAIVGLAIALCTVGGHC